MKGSLVSEPSDYPFDVLRSLLNTAARVADDLLNDPHLERLVKLFASMPEDDREPVISMLEREVRTRLISRKVADSLSQVALRPNPNAHIYFRVVEPEQEHPVETMAFLRTANSIQRGINALDPHWQAMVREAFRHMDSLALERINTFNRVIKDLLDDVMSEGTSEPERPAPENSPARPKVTKGARSRA